MNKRRQPKKEARPVQTTVFWLHGLAALGDERWEEAINAFRQFLDTVTDDEDRLMACYNLNTCYAESGQYDKALEILDEAEQYAPDDPEIIHDRGIVYACAGRIEEAIKAFEELGRRSRRYNIRHNLKQLRRIARGKLPPGDFLLDHLKEQLSHNVDMGDFHLVERKAHQMLEANPARAEGHFALGLACLEQKRYEEALEAFLAAHDRDPDYAPTIHNIGHTYVKIDSPEQALPWLERAYERDPEHIATLHQLGSAYEQLDQRDEAVMWWQKVLKIAPNHYLTQKRLHEIGEGPEPEEPPLPPQFHQIKRMMPIVKGRMRKPHIYRNGEVTLTYDRIGFTLEDTENPHNASIHAGTPYNLGRVPDQDADHVLDMMGMVKMLLQSVDADNTRSVAVLVYYQDRQPFNYQARFAQGEMITFDSKGQFVVTEVPRLFKVNIDSDLVTPYGNPMQGLLIYLSHPRKPGILISTLPQG